MCEQRTPQMRIAQKCRITLMRSAIIKKASQDEQQNKISQQKTNINYIQNFMSVLKKITEAQNSVGQN